MSDIYSGVLASPKNKKDYYDRWNKGEFGNKIRTIDCIDDLVGSGLTNFTIRYKDKGSQFCRYRVANVFEATKIMAAFILEGADPDLFTFNEAAPDDKLLIQGEVCRLYSGLNLTYSTMKSQMRTALSANPQYAKGLTAKCVLAHYLWPKSYDMIMELLDKYKDAVIEFSTYSIALGDIPHHNTIIWEVRNY